MVFFFVKKQTAYEIRISDWSSDVCSSDLASTGTRATAARVASESDLPLAPMFAVDVNEDVRFEFQVVNASEKKLEVKFADGRTHDWVVFDSQIGRASCRERVCQYV